MGPEGSENWHAMLDGAELILREEGHAALTSRRVAERIGVKQRLVYYYFRTMDDLVVSLFRRMAERQELRLSEAAAQPRPLRALWDISLHSTDSRLIAEFMALANRIEGLKREVVHFIESARRIETEVLAQVMDRVPQARNMGPASMAVTITSLALLLSRESQLGVDLGHEEILAALDAFLDQVEPLDAAT
ncbi:TetR/AcrR family transcriptional regulator [Novosphingobium sp. TH158]|uniref:TetR/AcrR family transcriptional regulator n=1 Tax=Novosphingobium sp. TH158 TaxID=2067455 RepID=UPI000C7D28C5|nr:TetR/AcrR family transcriptional regulator [Novosphingobium sp. TH158]PLK27065.1 TetR/AcrR family transcriptional regulator [Novosphingobium sp. TH158]